MAMRDPETLLYNAAATRAIGLGFRLGPGADNYFEYNAKQAATKLAAMEPGEQEKQLVVTVRNFQLLVDTMISERWEAYADDQQRLMSNEIGERSLSRALARLCPLFPFCE